MLVGLAVVWLVVGLWMVVLVPWDYPGDLPRVGDGAGSRQLGCAVRRGRSWRLGGFAAS